LKVPLPLNRPHYRRMDRSLHRRLHFLIQVCFVRQKKSCVHQRLAQQLEQKPWDKEQKQNNYGITRCRLSPVRKKLTNTNVHIARTGVGVEHVSKDG